MIVSPSNILLQPHVGRFHASDFDFFAHSQQVTFGHQLAPQRCRLATVAVVWHCIGVYQSDEHSQHDCKSLQHTFTATCWQVSCLRSRFFAHSHVTFGHQVAPQRCRLATVVVVWHCIGVYQSDEHSQHDCKSLHPTSQPHVGRFLASDLDFLPTLSR